jgi:acetyl-CoA C-acetyltransferase
MPEAFIVDAIRTAVGKRGGALAETHPADLGASVIRQVLERNGVNPAKVDDVIFGCVDNVGPQAGNIARTAWLAAGLPEQVPGVTVDRQCGSSQQAIHFAAQAIMSGTADIVVAGGVQNMSKIPISAAMIAGQQYGFPTPTSGSKSWLERYGDQEVSQFRGAELIADKWDISREDMERWALRSHERARAAIDAGKFAKEIVPIDGFSVDEGPRDTSLEKMASLKTLVEGGRLTAAVASQISDGASATLLASGQAVKDYGLTPRARIHHLSARGADPIFMLSAPIPATRYALAKSGLSIDDMDVIEINEAFAPVVLAWIKETGADPDRVNVNGGAIALGHPLGATGAKLFASLLNELERVGGRYGLLTICEGGGTANATIIERVGGAKAPVVYGPSFSAAGL